MPLLRGLKLAGAQQPFLRASGSGSGGPTVATTFTVNTNPDTGLAGTVVTLTITPAGGNWPAGIVVTPTLSGLNGTFTPSNASPTGTSPATFTITPVAAGGGSTTVGTFNATATGMTSLGGQGFTLTSNPGSTFSYVVSLPSASGAPGSPITVSVTPQGDVWPIGTVLTPAAPTGSLAGTWAPTSQSISGSATAIFTFTPTSGPGTFGGLYVNASPTAVGNGPQQYAVQTVSGAAFRMLASVSHSVQQVGQPVQVTLTPADGTWTAGSVTLSSSNGGSFSPSATATFAAGTTTPVTIAWTPANPGWTVLTPTNTAGLFSPGDFGVNVTTSAADNAVTITQTGSVWRHSIWERDVKSGNPTGWTTGWNKGWGQVLVPVTLAAGANKMYARLHDAMSSGALSSTPGTGTQLQGSVLVCGPVSAGNQVLRVNVPAGMFTYCYLDLCSKADFSSGVIRVAQEFAVGQRVAVFTRSYLCGLGLLWAYTNPANIPAKADMLSMCGGYGLASSLTGDERYGLDTPGDWSFHDGSQNSANGTSSTTGAMETCRMMSVHTGVMHGIIGTASTGGSLMDHLIGLGKISGNTIKNLGSATPGANKFSYAIFALRDGDMSQDQFSREYSALADWINSLGFPVSMVFAIGSGMYGPNGSFDIGYGRINDLILKMEATRPNLSVDWSDWCGYHGDSPHPDMLARVRYSRSLTRMLLTSEATALGGTGPNRGPVLTDQGSRASGSYIIDLPYTHHGGTTLIKLRAREANIQNDGKTNAALNTVWAYETPTDWEMTAAIAVRLAGDYNGFGRPDARDPNQTSGFTYPAGVQVKLDTTNGIKIDNANNRLRVYLSQETPGSITFEDGTTMPLSDQLSFDVNYNNDYTDPNYPTARSKIANGFMNFYVDDRVDPTDGVPHGYWLRAKIAAYIPPPVPATQTVSINSIATQVNGAWMLVTGTAAGAWISGQLRYALNGGSILTPAWQKIDHGNRWTMAVPLPPSTDNSSNTISVYRPSQSSPDATQNFVTKSRVVLLAAPTAADQAFASLSSAAASSYVESYWATARSLWRDAGATQQVSGQMQEVLAWDGESGNSGNRLTQSIPGLGLSMDFTGLRTFFPLKRRPDLVTEPGQILKSASNAPMLSQMTGDFTIATLMATGGSFFYPHIFKFLGTTAPQGGAGTTNGIGIYSYYNGTAYRGSNAFGGAWDVANVTLQRLVLRYRASDGLLELYAPTYSATPFANTAPPEAITLTGFEYSGGAFCHGPGIMMFKSRFSDADVAAMLTWLNTV